MDNQEAVGRQGPKAFPFPCLQASSILARACPCHPFPKAAARGRARVGVGRKREPAFPEQPLMPGARGPFYSFAVCLTVYVAIKLNLVDRPSSTGSFAGQILQTSA